MNQIFELEVATHQEPHGIRIPCCFEDVCEPARIPIRVNERVNRKTAIARRHNRRQWQIMLILKASAPKSPLLKEGTYDAVVGSVKGVPTDTDPKRVAIGFKLDGQVDEVRKEVIYSFNEGTPLRQDVETILRSQLTSSQAAAGFDPSKIIGEHCRVVVMHKATAGGKAKAVVSVVRAAGSAE